MPTSWWFTTQIYPEMGHLPCVLVFSHSLWLCAGDGCLNLEEFQSLGARCPNGQSLSKAVRIADLLNVDFSNHYWLNMLSIINSNQLLSIIEIDEGVIYICTWQLISIWIDPITVEICAFTSWDVPQSLTYSWLSREFCELKQDSHSFHCTTLQSIFCCNLVFMLFKSGSKVWDASHAPPIVAMRCPIIVNYNLTGHKLCWLSTFMYFNIYFRLNGENT